MQSWESTWLDLHRQVDELFDKLVYRPWAITGRSNWRPTLDLHETSEAYLVVVDLPDVLPEEVRLVVSTRDLVITGRRDCAPPQGVLCQRCERPRGPFERTLSLPQAVDPQKARAEYRQGTCRIHLPKKPSGGQETKSAASEGSPSEAMSQLTTEQALLTVEGARYVLRLDVP